MRTFSWVCLCLIGGLLSVSGLSAQAAPNLTQIGRGAVQSAQWSPDGSYVLVATVTGAWLYTPDLHDLAHIPDAKRARLSPDGRYIAGVDDTNTIRFWDAHSFAPLAVPKPIQEFRRVWDFEWSPDGRYFAASGERDEALLYAWDTENAWKTVMFGRMTGDDLVWSPHGQYLAVHNQSGGGFYVIASKDGSKQWLSALGSSIVWRDDTHLLDIALGDNYEAVLWDILTNKHGDTFEFLTLPAVYNHAGTMLAVGSDNSRVLIFDPATNQAQGSIDFGKSHNRWIGSLAWSPDDRQLAIGTTHIPRAPQPDEVVLANPQTDEVIRRWDGWQTSVDQLVWSPDGRYLLAVDDGGQLRMLNPTADQAYAVSDAHSLVGKTLAWKPDSSQIAIADGIDGVSLWDAQSVRSVGKLPNNGAPISVIQWQSNGNLLAVESRVDDNTFPYSLSFHIWDTQHQKDVTSRFALPAVAKITFFDWRPDGEQLAVTSSKPEAIYVWNSSGGDPETIPFMGNVPTGDRGLTWSPSGKFLVMLSSGGNSFSYDREKAKFTLNSASLMYGTVTWSAKESLIVLNLGGWGGAPPLGSTPKLSHQTAAYLSGPPGNRAGFSFDLNGLTSNTKQGFLSPHGRYAAAVDATGSGMIWDADTGAPITMLANTAAVVWSPDETRLVIQRTDGSL